MPVDFTDYTDPGVYIDIIDAPVTNLNGVAPTVVAIIGESSGSGRKITESTVLRSQYTTRLNSEGLDATTIKIKNRFSGVEYASAVFGTITTAIEDSDTSVDVTLSSLVPLPSTPFVIRIQDEYLKVTAKSVTDGVATLTVDRGTDSEGTASGSDAADYPAGLPVNLWSAFDVTDGTKYELVATLNDAALSNETPLNATVTTFFVVVADGETISVGDVLLFDNERMRVTAISNGADSSSITVERGVEGTRASAHGKITEVYRVKGYDFYVKMDSGSNADFDGVDDLAIIGCITNGRLAPTEDDEIVPNAESVEVSGFATGANQYAAELMTDLDDVKDKYGLPTAYSTGTTSVNSPLTLAAQLAFANGARQVYCIAIDSTETDKAQAFKDAIDKVSNIDNVNVIVPLTASLSMADSDLVFDYLLEFINTQAALGVLTRGFVAYDGLMGALEPYDFSALAQKIASSRISVVAPGRFKVSTPTGNISVGGPFAAAAVAGLQASFDAQEPLTRKTLESTLLFSVEDKINAQKMIDMQSKGVLVLFNDRTGRVTVRHGLTTDMSNSYMREISVVTARDRLRDLIYDTLQTAGILGSPITSTTPERVVANVTGALESAKRTNLIFDYADIKYRIPANDPTAIEVRFAYRPTMPLNYVLIQFSIDTVNASVFFETVNQGGVV